MAESPTTQPIRPESAMENDDIGEQFHRFQRLKGSDFSEASNCFHAFACAIRRRIAREETEIFPSFLQRVGGSLENTCAALRQEHSDVVDLLDRIAAKLNESNPATEAEESALQRLLSDHNHREHSVVFPALD